MSASRGLFIVFEGLDGAGKSTQADLLLAELRREGHQALSVREPGGTPLGDRLREILLGRDDALGLEPQSELLLYEASRCQLVRQVIRPALARGQTVISGRYVLSSLAYQGYGRGLALELIEQLNREATGGLEPELTFWIDLAPEVGLARLRAAPDRMERLGLDFYRRVAAGYRELAQGQAQIIRLDGERSQNELARQVAQQVRQLSCVANGDKARL